jgi:hypothetical protein
MGEYRIGLYITIFILLGCKNSELKLAKNLLILLGEPELKYDFNVSNDVTRPNREGYKSTALPNICMWQIIYRVGGCFIFN